MREGVFENLAFSHRHSAVSPNSEADFRSFGSRLRRSLTMTVCGAANLRRAACAGCDPLHAWGLGLGRLEEVPLFAMKVGKRPGGGQKDQVIERSRVIG